VLGVAVGDVLILLARGKTTAQVTDGLVMRYSTNDPTKTYSAVLVKEEAEYSRMYTAAATSLAGGEVVTFQISSDLSTFTYVNPGGSKQYELGLEQTGEYPGDVSFPGLQIGANEAHVVTVEDWNHLSTTRITIGMDQGNDGSIDEAIALQGQPHDDAPNSMEEVMETSPDGEKIERTIAPRGDEDWFRFELTEGAKIKIHLTSLPADCVYFYDENGILLEGAAHRGRRAEHIIRHHQPPGIYYVRVKGYAGAFDENDSYKLRFKVNSSSKGRAMR